MGTTNDKLNRVKETKAAIKAAIGRKGVTVPEGATFRSYEDYIDDIEQAEPTYIQYQKTVTFDGEDMTIQPDAGYDGLGKVSVLAGNKYLPMPEEYKTFYDTALTHYTDPYAAVMVMTLDKYTNICFLLGNFAVQSYDPSTTEFTAVGWVCVQYNALVDTWTVQDYSQTASTGLNYAEHIRWASTYIQYGEVTLWPLGDEPESGGNSGAVYGGGLTADRTAVIEMAKTKYTEDYSGIILVHNGWSGSAFLAKNDYYVIFALSNFSVVSFSNDTQSFSVTGAKIVRVNSKATITAGDVLDYSGSASAETFKVQNIVYSTEKVEYANTQLFPFPSAYIMLQVDYVHGSYVYQSDDLVGVDRFTMFNWTHGNTHITETVKLLSGQYNMPDYLSTSLTDDLVNCVIAIRPSDTEAGELGEWQYDNWAITFDADTGTITLNPDENGDYRGLSFASVTMMCAADYKVIVPE